MGKFNLGESMAKKRAKRSYTINKTNPTSAHIPPISSGPKPLSAIVNDQMFANDSKIAKMVLDKMGTKAATQKTADGFDNFVSRLGLNNDNALSAGMYAFNLLTRNRVQLEAAYRGSWVVGQVIDCIAEDMTRAGIDVTTSEGAEELEELYAMMSKLQIWQSLCSGIKWGRLYGGALGILQIEGQDLATPINLDTIGEGQFQGIVVYDRWQLNPDLTNVIDSGPEMGLPKYYYIVTNNAMNDPAETQTGQIKVHHSRCIRFIGNELPFFQAITEMMWGESILERLWDRLIAFDTATLSSANLINRAQLRTIGVDGLRQILAAGGKAQEGLIAQFEYMRMLQTNEGLTLMDKEDTFASTAYSFAGLSDMMLQFGQQLSGSSNIPLIRLFGQSPAGLNSNGDSDIRLYYDNINAKQESGLRNGIEMILKVMWRSCFGKPSPKEMQFTFTPLWQMSAMDKATVAKTNSETIIGAFDAGLNDRATSMKELRQTSGDTGIFSNITDDQIKEAEEEEPPIPIELEGDPNADPAANEEQKKEVPNLDHLPNKISVFEKIKKWLEL